MGKYDVVDFDDYNDQTEPPTPGIYPGKLTEFDAHKSAAGKDGYRWRFAITEGDFAGWSYNIYTNMTTAKWKTQQVVNAITGGARAPFTLNPKQASRIVKDACPVKIQVGSHEYNDEMRADIKTIFLDKQAAEKWFAQKSDSDDDDGLPDDPDMDDSAEDDPDTDEGYGDEPPF